MTPIERAERARKIAIKFFRAEGWERTAVWQKTTQTLIFDIDAAIAQAVAAERERVTLLRKALAEHACPIMLGQGSVWCGEHKVYHRPDIDAALRADAEAGR